MGDQEKVQDKRKKKLKLKIQNAEKRLMKHVDEEYNVCKIIRIDNIYTAVGYGSTNCTLIEGKPV